jgi:prolyl-tRNA editing enzyme YbaK/EbsC (Cys-tRNA(Pro) deacylase)
MRSFYSSGMQRVTDAAAQRGVALDFRLMPSFGLTAEELAAALDADLGAIVKSIVCVVPRGVGFGLPVICLVSGRNRLDLDLLAAVTGEAAIRETTALEAQTLLGYPEGAAPPFGHGHDVRTVMDQSLGCFQWLWASAGFDSAVFRISPATLQMLSNALVAPVANSSWMRPIGDRAIDRHVTHTRKRRLERTRRPRAGDGL